MNKDNKVQEMGAADLVNIERDRVRCPACGAMSSLLGGPDFRLAPHQRPPRVEASGEPPHDKESAYQIDVVQGVPCWAASQGVDLSRVLRLRMPKSVMLSAYERTAGALIRSAADRDAYLLAGANLVPLDPLPQVYVRTSADYELWAKDHTDAEVWAKMTPDQVQRAVDWLREGEAVCSRRLVENPSVADPRQSTHQPGVITWDGPAWTVTGSLPVQDHN